MATDIIMRRDAVTGKLVTEEYVRKHPRTTETEHRKRRSKTGGRENNRSKSR
jgi:hypothetical protein